MIRYTELSSESLPDCVQPPFFFRPRATGLPVFQVLKKRFLPQVRRVFIQKIQAQKQKFPKTDSP